MAALPSTGTGFSGITDNNFTDETPVLFLKDAAGAAFTVDADKGLHTQRISSMIATVLRQLLAIGCMTDNNSAATATEDINVYSISFDANGNLSEAIKTDREQLTEADSDRFDLVGELMLPNLDPQKARIWVGEKLATTADNARQQPEPWINAGLLIASENWPPMPFSRAPPRATHPPTQVLFCCATSMVIPYLGDGTAAGYQIDGQRSSQPKPSRKRLVISMSPQALNC